MSKKQHNDEPIVLDEALGKSEAFVLKYKNSIMAAIVAIVVIVVGYIAYTKYISEPYEQEAKEAMYIAEQVFAAKDFEQALNGDSLNTFMGFVQVAEEYSGTEAGNLANAYAGISLAQLGRYEEAISYLEDFDADDRMIAPAVKGTLGQCYANVGRPADAVECFVDAAEIADNNTLSSIYLREAGIVSESMVKNTDALKYYERIKNDYPLSMPDVDKYIERVK